MSVRSRSLPVLRSALALASATILVVATPALASATTVAEPADPTVAQQDEAIDLSGGADALEGEDAGSETGDQLDGLQSGAIDEGESDLVEEGQEEADLVEEEAQEEATEADIEEPVVASRSLMRAAPQTVTKCEIPLASHAGSISTGSVARIGGDTRYATALKVAQTIKSQSASQDRAVFIASGADYADGLTLGALASAANWPLLLTTPQSLDTKVRDYIAKVAPTHIYIAGGTGAVSKKAESQILAAAPSNAKVTRFAGSDRYETSKKIADCFDAGKPAFVATGTNYADAVIAGAPAAKAGAPVVLSKGSALTQGTKAALSSLKPSTVNIIGGSWNALQKNSVAKAAGGAKVSVYSGKNRYATAAAVAKSFYGASPKTAVYATGTAFPDALAGGAVAKNAGAPILLTKSTCRPKEIEAVSKSNKTKVVLGGAKTVSDKSHTTTCVSAPKPTAPTKTLLSVAKAQVGKPYVSGAAGPNAFDCSGLTQYVYQQNGKNIPRTTWQQWSAGTRVSTPRAGDVIVMGGGSHVGIYVSPGVMIDAGNPRVGVSMRGIYATPNAYVRF